MTIEQMIARQQELLNAARSAGRNMTREEAAEFDSLQRSIDAARAAGAGIAHGGQSSTPAAPANNTPEGQRQQTPAAGEGGNGGQDPQNAQRAIEAERQRIRSIEDLCTEFGLDARSYIDNGSTEEQVRAAVLEHLRSQHSPVATGIQVTDTQEDKFRRAAADSLLMRSGMTLERPEYKEGYRKVAVTFDKFTKKGSLKDFKKHDNYYVAGPVGEFYEVPENGELKHDIFKDDKLPQRQLKTYGRQFTLSRKAFIDDDIGLVTSLPARYAAAARKTINKQVYQILINNSNIYDGAELFGEEHKNLLASGTGVTQEAMQTMIMALANQKDQFGESIIINPATIVVPSGMKFDMYTLFFSPTINTSDNTQAVNPLYQYRDSIEVVEDPTINALCGGLGNVMPWFLIGDPGDTDFIEVDYLNGQEIPNIRRMEAPGQLGFIWDIYLDWGISVMDYRGAVKNPGIKVDTKLKLV